MFSIIVCSLDTKRLQNLTTSIKATAGAEYELLAYQNVQGKGLCEVYNQQAAKARFNHLCFVHEDVLFHTSGWCEKIAALLKDVQTGVVGVMGSRYKASFGAGWRDGETDAFHINVKDGTEGGKLLLQNVSGKKTNEVICLDGAFLCCSKAHWQAHPFDEKTFSGFHFYDLDFCLQMREAGLRNWVTYEVTIEHFSRGTKDAAFINDFFSFQEKWSTALPQYIGTMSTKNEAELEGYALAETLQLMKKNHYGLKERREQLNKYRNRYKNLYHLLRSFYFGFVK